MDRNLPTVDELRIKRVIAALEKNNIDGFMVRNQEELLEKVREIIPKESVIGSGNSMTLRESGVLELLKNPDYKFVGFDLEGMSMEQIMDSLRRSLTADVFVTSTNAITEDGWLYNVDNLGNRVAPMLFGPKKVVVVCGKNKIVRDLNAAIARVEDVAAPSLNVGWNANTPCAKTGKCADCKSPQRICNEYTLIKRQSERGRMHIIFTTWDMGF
jgi:hypothetical protein